MHSQTVTISAAFTLFHNKYSAQTHMYQRHSWRDSYSKRNYQMGHWKRSALSANSCQMTNLAFS